MEKSKTIIIQLEKGKSARHLIFEIRLSNLGRKSRNFETLEEVGEDAPVLSICGSDHLTGCPCQQQDRIKNYRPRVKAKDLEMFDFLMSTWYKYHLNDMKAGTKQQSATLEGSGCKGWASSYDEDCAKLESLGLLYDRGYKYGTSWLYMPIDSETLAKLDEIMQ